MTNEESIEYEPLYPGGQEPEIKNPFDPRQVDIVALTMTVSNIVDRLKYDDIDLNPDFQRNHGLWSDEQQSRLIESLIIRIPLPSFYFDTDKDDKYIVVDGLQRLWSLYRYIVLPQGDKDKLRLTGLEYLTEYEGMSFEELPPQIRRRINEQQIIAFVIREGTPEKVRVSIFTRINTGGIHLEPAEIRNSVYRGKPANVLKFLADSKEFQKATRHKISPDRMEDREFVNRFISFYSLGYQEYSGKLDDFLSEGLEYLKTCTDEEIHDIENAFIQAMSLSWNLFGEKSFRRIQKDGSFGAINKPLYEVVSVVLARLTSEECIRLTENREAFWQAHCVLLKNQEFLSTITSATAQNKNVETRYRMFSDLVHRFSHD